MEKEDDYLLGRSLFRVYVLLSADVSCTRHISDSTSLKNVSFDSAHLPEQACDEDVLSV